MWEVAFHLWGARHGGAQTKLLTHTSFSFKQRSSARLVIGRRFTSIPASARSSACSSLARALQIVEPTKTWWTGSAFLSRSSCWSSLWCVLLFTIMSITYPYLYHCIIQTFYRYAKHIKRWDDLENQGAESYLFFVEQSLFKTIWWATKASWFYSNDTHTSWSQHHI